MRKVVIVVNRHPSSKVRSELYIREGYKLINGASLGSRWKIVRVIGLLVLLFELALYRPVETCIIKSSNVRLLTFARQLSKTLVFDIDDAVWGDSLWGKKVTSSIFSCVDSFVCDNDYLKYYIELHYKKESMVRVGSIPICEFDDEYRLDFSKSGKLIIGWVGSVGTSYNLYAIADFLKYIDNHDKFQLAFLGVSKDVLANLDIKNAWIKTRYNEMDLCEFLKNSMDLGLFPMYDVENNWGRGYHKLRLYRTNGLPSLVSDIRYKDSDLPSSLDLVYVEDGNWINEFNRFYENRFLHGNY